MSLWTRGLTGFAVLLCVASSANAADAVTGATDAAKAGAADTGTGAAVFQRVCAACHLATAQTVNTAPGDVLNARAVPREILKTFSAGAVLNALTNGKMQVQAGSLSTDERRAVAEYASGKSLDPGASAAAEKPNLCTDKQVMRDPAAGPGWNGWGNGIHNTRNQTKAQGGLTAADIPSLELKWAFGYANVSSARTQPSVAGGRLFIASENSEVRALNPRTGCSYWTYKAQGGVATAPIVGPYRTAAGKSGYAVFFGDRQANAYAVDAQTGQQVWTHKADEQPFAGITGSLTYFSGKVIVPIQGIAEERQGAINGRGCCTLRGNVTALDSNTGAILWKTYTVGETLPRGKTKEGVQTYGPAGGGIWSAPTIDPKRGLVYVGTGNSYADPSQSMTDAVVALDLNSGAVEWVRQVIADDNWVQGCKQSNPDNAACPAQMGPDYDFSAPPSLVTVHGRDLIVLPQKAAIAWALDPDKQGEVVWKSQFGKGSGLGGQWGGAFDGERVYFGVADLLTPTPGGMRALSAIDGKVVWSVPAQEKLCGTQKGCNSGQGGALTVIPGAVLNSGMDGGIRAYSTRDGSILWTYDTNRGFDTVNGLKAHGGSMDSSGPVVAGGMMYVNSGWGGLVGVQGNVLLAFGPKH